MYRALLWFKRDLRLDDHPALRAALSADRLLPVFVLDPEWLVAGPSGTRPLGVHRARFLLESLAALDAQLRAAGSRLMVVAGHPHEVLATLVEHLGIDEILALDEADPDGRAELSRLGETLAQRGVGRLRRYPEDRLLAPQQASFADDDGPLSFDAFVERIDALQPVFQPAPAAERLAPLPEGAAELCLPIPTLSQLGFGEPQAVADSGFPFAGGEPAARARLRDYLWVSLDVRRYDQGEPGLACNESCSRLSPWLSLGCLSPRRVAAELRRHEAQFGANLATREFWRGLLRREYLRLFLPRLGVNTPAVAPEMDSRFTTWSRGVTGMPVVDAAMRELSATGFLSHRARHLVASYLVHDLQQDWRLGASWFREHQIDHDPASNWGNWAMIAQQTPQDALQQARRYDAQASYVGLWVPELRLLPSALRHTPFLLPEEQFTALGYPRLEGQLPNSEPPPSPDRETRAAS